jgi:hypothetical protein
MQLMACAVAYQGGVAVAITLAAIYAEQVIGFQPQENHGVNFCAQHCGAGRFFGFGICPRQNWPQVGLVSHPLGLGINLYRSSIEHQQRNVLVGGRTGWGLHGLQSIDGQGPWQAC